MFIGGFDKRCRIYYCIIVLNKRPIFLLSTKWDNSTELRMHLFFHLRQWIKEKGKTFKCDRSEPIRTQKHSNRNLENPTMVNESTILSILIFDFHGEHEIPVLSTHENLLVQ